MAGRKLFVGALYGAWLITASIGFVAAVPQGNPEKSRSALSILTDGWGPLTPEEEIIIASYLKQNTEAYLNLVEALDPKSFTDRSYLAGETAHLLQLTVSDLKISLRETITTLGLIERLHQQRPADYVQSAPILWLTVVKDMSLEKGNAKDIERLGLVKSNWHRIVEISLPRLFSRILEPKLTEFLRRGTQR
jgi:hypothetical protein